MSISRKRIVTICTDIVSAIDTEQYYTLEKIIPTTSHLGRLARFINALRTDVKRSKLVTKQYIEKLAKNHGINPDAYVDFSDYIRDLNFIDYSSSGKIRIKIESIDDVYNTIGRIWEKKMRGQEESEDFYIVLVMNALYRPYRKKDIQKEFKGIIDLNSLLDAMIKLNLILYDQLTDIYFSPKFFGNNINVVSEFVEEKGAATDKFIDFLEVLSEHPGFPLPAVPPHIKPEVKIARRVGLIEPITVTVGQNSVEFLFDPTITNDKLYLSKECLSHFRYNQYYATKVKGRLHNPNLFLGKLIREGTAGSADNIAINYEPLELKGVITVGKGGLSEFPYMTMRKKDVIKDTKELLIGKIDVLPNPKLVSLSDWIKNPSETRAGYELFKSVQKKQRLDLKKLLRDEVY